MSVTSSCITKFGTGTVRRPARDFGGPKVGVSSRLIVLVSATSIVAVVAWTRVARRAASSPLRRPA